MANDFTRHKENQSFQKKRTIQASCRVGPLVESCCFFFFGLVLPFYRTVLRPHLIRPPTPHQILPWSRTVLRSPLHSPHPNLTLVSYCLAYPSPPPLSQILPWSRTVLRTPLPLPLSCPAFPSPLSHPKSYLGLVLSYAPLSPSPPPLSPQSYLGLVLSCVSLRSVAFSR